MNYVYNDIEVKLTGRKASKPGVGGKVSVLHEITPADENNGDWKKWVPMQVLFQIEEQPKLPVPMSRTKADGSGWEDLGAPK